MPHLDKAGGQEKSGALGRKEWQLVKSCHGLSDAFRVLNPDKKAFSYSNYDNIFTRIDKFYVSAYILNVVKKVEYVPFYLSDHDAVCMQIDFDALTPEIRKGRGFWKLNCKILDDEEVVKVIEDVWLDAIVSNERSLQWRARKSTLIP